MTSSHDHRIAVLAEQAASGLSILQFCRRRGIALSTFHSWRSRLHDRRRRSDRGRVGGGGESRTAAAFVEAIVPASASVSASAPSVPIVELRCGRRVAVPRGFDADDLARLLRLVESLDGEARP
jgi:transposase-like protein